MKAENFKTENLEKLSDEGKDENIDNVKKKLPRGWAVCTKTMLGQKLQGHWKRG